MNVYEVPRFGQAPEAPDNAADLTPATYRTRLDVVAMPGEPDLTPINQERQREPMSNARYYATLVGLAAVLLPTAVYGSHKAMEWANTCATVGQAGIKEAEALLATPDKPELLQTLGNRFKIIHYNADYTAASISFTDYAADHKLRAQFIGEQAAENDLTTKDYWPFAEQLEADILNETPALPADTYYNQAKAFLSTYGVTLRSANSNDELSHNFRPANGKEWESVTNKKSLLNLMRYVSGQPVEYLKEAGIEEYVIAVQDHRDHSDRVALAYHKDKTVVINVNTEFTSETAGHETGHGADEEICGKYSIDNDPGYSALNDGQKYKNVLEAATEGSLETYQAQIYAAKQKLAASEHTPNENTEAAEKEIERIQQQAVKSVFLTNYSKAGIAEDKADIHSMITHVLESKYSYRDILGMDCSIRRKAVYLIARAMSHSDVSRRAMRYFASVQWRH